MFSVTISTIFNLGTLLNQGQKLPNENLKLPKNTYVFKQIDIFK